MIMDMKKHIKVFLLRSPLELVQWLNDIQKVIIYENKKHIDED